MKEFKRLYFRIMGAWNDVAGMNTPRQPAPPLAIQPPAGKTHEPFKATIVSIKSPEDKTPDANARTYEVVLKREDFGSLMPAILLPTLERGSNVRFDTLAPGDVIKTISYGKVPGVSANGALLGPIEKCGAAKEAPKAPQPQ